VFASGRRYPFGVVSGFCTATAVEGEGEGEGEEGTVDEELGFIIIKYNLIILLILPFSTKIVKVFIDYS